MVTIEEMAANWRRRANAVQSRVDDRARRVRDLLPAVKQLLTDRYGARRVVLFGSFARGDSRESSDVDIAVEGLDGARYFTAMSELSGLLASPVDLVELESAQPSLRERIAFEGVPL